MKTKETQRLSAVLIEWDGKKGLLEDTEGKTYRVARKQLLGAADIQNLFSTPNLAVGDKIEVFAGFAADTDGMPDWLFFRKMPQAGEFSSGMLPIFSSRAEGLAGRKFYVGRKCRRRTVFFMILFVLAFWIEWRFEPAIFVSFLLIMLVNFYFLLVSMGWQWTAGEEGLVSGGVMPFFVNWHDIETVVLWRYRWLGLAGLKFSVRPERAADGRCRYYLDLSMLDKPDFEESLAVVREKTGLPI